MCFTAYFSIYDIDGNYGDYDITINFIDDKIKSLCTCPYYSSGCKHVVAVRLDIIEHVIRYKDEKEKGALSVSLPGAEELSREDIKRQAVEDRAKRAKSE